MPSHTKTEPMADCFTGALCVLGTLVGSVAYALGRWLGVRHGASHRTGSHREAAARALSEHHEARDIVIHVRVNYLEEVEPLALGASDDKANLATALATGACDGVPSVLHRNCMGALDGLLGTALEAVSRVCDA